MTCNTAMYTKLTYVLKNLLAQLLYMSSESCILQWCENAPLIEVRQPPGPPAQLLPGKHGFTREKEVGQPCLTSLPNFCVTRMSNVMQGRCWAVCLYIYI